MNKPMPTPAADSASAFEIEAPQRCRLLFADQLNLARGKYIPMSEAQKGHARFCVGTYAVTYDKQLVDAPGGGLLDGLPDMEMAFDPAAMRKSWEPGTSIALGQLNANGESFPLCGRSALIRAIEAWRARGLEPMIGIELEAYIYEQDGKGGWMPYDTPGAFVYGTGPFADPAGLIEEIWAAAQACDIPVESINAEFDTPQWELTMRYADALKSADDAFLFRQMARELLFKRGYLLSFLPKPLADKSGSGMHFNLSFRDKDGTNIFAADVASGNYSDVMKGAIAGMLKHHRALAGIMAPLANSYDRLRPASLSGYWANWGVDHRSVTVRVSAEQGPAARIEHRLGDCSASPYFALAALLQAARLGVENGYALPDPETADGLDNVSTDLHAPESLDEALEALAEDNVLTDAVGADLVANYISIKQQESLNLKDLSEEERIAYYLYYI